MTTSPNQYQIAIWKRSLIGGLLSAGIAGTMVVLMYLLNFFPIPLVGFMTVGIVISNIFFEDSNLWISIVSVVFWFLAGSVIAHYFNKNRLAIKFWTILFIVSSVLFLVFYFLPHFSGFGFYLQNRANLSPSLIAILPSASVSINPCSLNKTIV